MKIKKIKIEKFRHMREDVEIEFGDRLTVISGQNGTGKSTILGMVGQVFDYKGAEKTKNNLEFATKYSEIFTFCKTYDKPKDHKYEAEVEIDKKTIIKQVKSRYSEAEKRFRLDVGIRGKGGTGAIDHPVIYLGLRRLFPLAQEKENSIKIKRSKLSEDEARRYGDLAAEILVATEVAIEPEGIKSPNKESLAMKTSEYSHLGNSAGQDNLGQIISAILSFEELKTKLGDDYKGGILLIDELDATLYASTQVTLLEELYKVARDCDLQIIFTSHSLEVLEYLKSSNIDGYKINFLEVKGNKVFNEPDYSMSEIRSNILNETNQVEKLPPIYVLCEDEVTKIWCQFLLKPTKKRLKGRLHIGTLPCGSGDLKNLATTKHPLFKGVVFVLDADCNGKRSYEKCPRTVILPGKHAPERELYEFLRVLKDDDQFWDNDYKFTKKVCFKRFANVNNSEKYKQWFETNRTDQARWGRGLLKVLNRWGEDNEMGVKKFREKFEKEIEKIEKKK